MFVLHTSGSSVSGSAEASWYRLFLNGRTVVVVNACPGRSASVSSSVVCGYKKDGSHSHWCQAVHLSFLVIRRSSPLPLPNGLRSSVENEQWHTFSLSSTNMFTCQVIFIVLRNYIRMFFMWIARRHINTTTHSHELLLFTRCN